MARFTAHKSGCLGALLGALALVGGCAPQGVVENLPAANYHGPLVQAPTPPVAVVPVKPLVKAFVPEVKKPMATPGVPRDWIPNVRKSDAPWEYIVIHHSATPTGGAAAFDRMHRQKGWDELGYHFVIGNGSDTRDGQVEVGSRWPKQKHGAHAKTPDNRFNERGIGICLVGNFDNERLDGGQRQSLARLVAYLMKTYQIAPANVIGHGDTKATDCPGKNVHVADVVKAARQMLADSGEAPAVIAKRPSGELLVEVGR